MNSSLDILDEIINKIDYKPFGGLILTKSSGKGTYSWLKWITIIFEKPIKSYIGVQIYPYYIERRDIGNITEDDDNDTHIFPHDYRKRFRISNNMAIDMETGNIMKKSNEVNELQIWFCQHIRNWEKVGDHKCILENGYKDDKSLESFYRKYYNRKELSNKLRQYDDILQYYDKLKAKSLVSNKIEIKNNSVENICSVIGKEIIKMINENKCN